MQLCKNVNVSNHNNSSSLTPVYLEVSKQLAYSLLKLFQLL